MQLLGGDSSSAPYTEYTIGNSLLLNGSTQSLSWSPGTATDRKTFTIRAMVKRAALGADTIMSGYHATSNFASNSLHFDSSDRLCFQDNDGTTQQYFIGTSRKFRDLGAWYDILISFDSTESTAADRIKMYVNGVQQTDFYSASYPSASFAASGINGTSTHYIGVDNTPTTGLRNYFSGYIAEFYFIDGVAHAVTDFGEFHANSGAWRAIEPSGLTYGTNGAYLDFADASPNLGDDESGNANDWTENSSPVQADDSPTKNYATWNQLAYYAGAPTFANGNKKVTSVNQAPQVFYSTIGVEAGQWYMECPWAGNINAPIGIAADTDAQLRSYVGDSDGSTSVSFWPDGTDLSTYVNGALVSSDGSGWTASDIMGLALDMDAQTISCYKNNVLVKTYDFSALGWERAFFACGNYVTGLVYNAAFSDADFTYTPPADHLALSAVNLPDATIIDPSTLFNVATYTGNGTAIGSGGNAISGVGFQPDFAWIKNRDATDNHMLYDAVRTATKDLHSNTADAEATDTEGLATFDSDGFTVGSNVEVNTNTEDYVAALWKADGTAGASNTDGTITATVAAGEGFSIAKWAGTGAAGTIGHGLSAAPELIITKPLASTTYNNWYVYHAKDGATEAGTLNSTAAFSALSQAWNDTAPTADVFSVGTYRSASSIDYIGYCFRPIPGFAYFGDYVGNGNVNGPFAYCGFKPRWLMVKRADSTSSWYVFDAERLGYNVDNNFVYADGTAAEQTTDIVDLTSTGFKLRSATMNVANGTYVFAAFAERPIGGANLPRGLAV